jgi:hypothetical protein
MSAITDFCSVIRGWLNLGEEIYSNSVVTSWARMSEEYLSEKLRCKHMVQIDWSVVSQDRVLLPSDWLELDTVRVKGGKPLIYSPRDYFYDNLGNNEGKYTIVGNYIFVGNIDAVNGTEVELSYYQTIPPLENDPTWLYKFYNRLFILTTLWHASMYAIEDERGPTWSGAVDDYITAINTTNQLSKASGSILVSKRRASFG